MSYRCPLGRLTESRDDPEEIKREGWQEQKILVVHVDDYRLTGFQREFVKQIGESLYGERKRKK